MITIDNLDRPYGQVALLLAASGDTLRWLDDERASQSGVVLLGARARGDPRGSANVW